MAIYVGPLGYATLGQFQKAVQMISTLGKGAINISITKYTAEYNEDLGKKHALWRTAGTISLVGTVLVAACVILFSKNLASWFGLGLV